MKPEKTTLYFKQGKSDKIYKASLEKTDSNSFIVNFAYGRRGATLKTGTKTKAPVDYPSAKKIYDKLVKSKTVKGYKPGEKGAEYVHTDIDARETGVQCQLLNFIEEAEVIRLIDDAKWWAQEKHDGKRMLVLKKESTTPINRRGLSTGAPDTIIRGADRVEGAFLIDGEAVGEKLFTFDILEVDDTDLRPAPYSQRMSHLENLGFTDSIIVVETAKTKKEKQQLFDNLKASKAEGIVFKKHSAPYTAGRPNSGGTQMKFKFYATASVIVTGINVKNSVKIAVIKGKKTRIDVGNVTIPPNRTVPAVDSIIEVRYLYAYKGGSLYQPVYLGKRDDIGLSDCMISQLKYKKETE